MYRIAVKAFDTSGAEEVWQRVLSGEDTGGGSQLEGTKIVGDFVSYEVKIHE